MANALSNRSAEELLTLGTLIAEIISTVPNPYGITTDQLAALTDGDTAVADALAAQVNARNAEMAATQAKKAERASLLATVKAISASAYSNPAVTDSMLLEIGLDPRRTGRGAPARPVTPSDFVVVPSADGTVKLKWNRGENGQTVMFLIEWSPNGAAWSFLKATKRTSFTALNFPPGVGAWFRVKATTSTAASWPTQPLSVYVAMPLSALSKAA